MVNPNGRGAQIPIWRPRMCNHLQRYLRSSSGLRLKYAAFSVMAVKKRESSFGCPLNFLMDSRKNSLPAFDTLKGTLISNSCSISWTSSPIHDGHFVGSNTPGSNVVPSWIVISKMSASRWYPEDAAASATTKCALTSTFAGPNQSGQIFWYWQEIVSAKS